MNLLILVNKVKRNINNKKILQEMHKVALKYHTEDKKLKEQFNIEKTSKVSLYGLIQSKVVAKEIKEYNDYYELCNDTLNYYYSKEHIDTLEEIYREYVLNKMMADEQRRCTFQINGQEYQYDNYIRRNKDEQIYY